MIFAEKYLNPHNIFQEKNFEEYCSKIPEFYFKNGVPEDVIKNFEVVEKLLALSYYEYKFIDEAYAKAIYTFEMAMSIRYKDFYPNSGKVMFNALINKLSKMNLFETNIQTLNYIRELRNYYSHPERHSFGGLIFWNRIEYISRLINEMYEDVTLRLQRVKLSKEFISKLQTSKMNKAVVIEIQNEPTILYRLQLLFINNKETPNTYLLACTPLFDLEIKEGVVKIPYSFKAKIKDLSFTNNKITGTSFLSSANITFSPISQNKELLPNYEAWNSEYDKVVNKFQFESNINYFLPDIFVPEIQEFQKM